MGLLTSEGLGAGAVPHHRRRQVRVAEYFLAWPVGCGCSCLKMGFYWLLSPSPGNRYLGKGKYRIGSRYKKVVYREYTDDSFSVQKKQQPSQQHLGILGTVQLYFQYFVVCWNQKRAYFFVFACIGPIIKAEVGEQIVITFKNKASRPYSITAHGVRASGVHSPVSPGEIIEAAGSFFYLEAWTLTLLFSSL